MKDINDNMYLLLVGMCLLLGMVCYSTQSLGEDRIKIAMIDGGISPHQSKSDILCENGVKTMIPYDHGYSTDSHGINIFNLIKKGLDPKRYCIVSYKVWSSDRPNIFAIRYTVQAIEDAIAEQVKYLNISMSGGNSSEKELRVLKKATQYMKVIVAAGNQSSEVGRKRCSAYPACYNKHLNNNFYVIGGSDLKESNYGSQVDFYTNGLNMGTPVLSGTSQATAYFTNNLIKNTYKNVVYTNRSLYVRTRILRNKRD